MELADTLVDDFDVVDFLHRLAVHCVDLLDVQAAGLILTGPGGNLHTAAASAEHPWLLGLFDLQQEQGPCFECYRTAAPVPPRGMAETLRRWPEFGTAAQQAGFASSYTVPLRLREDVIGALQLLASAPEEAAHTAAGDRDGMQVAQALADTATLGILQQRTLRQREQLAGQLQSALDSRVVVEQAKGVLAERCGVSVDEGFTMLRGYARSHSARLSQVARDVVDGRLGIPQPGPSKH